MAVRSNASVRSKRERSGARVQIHAPAIFSATSQAAQLWDGRSDIEPGRCHCAKVGFRWLSAPGEESRRMRACAFESEKQGSSTNGFEFANRLNGQRLNRKRSWSNMVRKTENEDPATTTTSDMNKLSLLIRKKNDWTEYIYALSLNKIKDPPWLVATF